MFPHASDMIKPLMQHNYSFMQGMFCPRGSAHPRKCPALAACPAGAAAPGFNAGAFITIILGALVYLAVFLTARCCLQRRSARRKQQQASRNQVCCLKSITGAHQCSYAY